MDSELSASSNEADAAALVGAGTSAEPEASSDHNTPKEPDAPSFVANPEGVLVSVRSSSDWEEVTTPDATFLGVALEARAAREGVEVPGAHTRGHAHHQSQWPCRQMGRQTSIPACIDSIWLGCHSR